MKIQKAELIGLDPNSISLLTKDEQLTLLNLNSNINFKCFFNLKSVNEIPDKEFWDQKVFVSNLISHPPPVVNNLYEKDKLIIVPNILTKKEKIKIRRLKTKTKNELIREKQKLGLIKAPKARLTYKNYLRVLVNEALIDPTSAEKKVKQAYKERFYKMLKENQERKLTKNQKKEKFIRKLERDIKKECKAVLFKFENLSNQQLYKIKINAKQLFLTGFMLKYDKDMTKYSFYLEGGGYAISKFVKLITKRIKWNESENQSKYSFLWEGYFKERLFKKLYLKKITFETKNLKFIETKGLLPFWKLIKNSDYIKE